MFPLFTYKGAGGSIVGWGNMLQAGRSGVRFPMRSLNFQFLPNPSRSTMVLGSTRPLTQMSTRNLPGGKGWPARKADDLTAICKSSVWKMWEPRRLTTLCASTACYRDSFTITVYLKHVDGRKLQQQENTVVHKWDQTFLTGDIQNAGN
jgi:hypothetical protein